METIFKNREKRKVEGRRELTKKIIETSGTGINAL